MVHILVIWRGKKLNVEIDIGSSLKQFGNKLQHLTNVKSDTMRLLVPRSSDKTSIMLMPFSDEHSSLKLEETPILEVKSIRMMGVFEDEIEQVQRSGTKADMRIAGFDEEEKRLRQRMSDRSHTPLRLPQGNYIFCDFRTLDLPGIKLNPPASEALKRMHMLAADPGIVAIMNKHRWRVGIMTEMAPEGYVGISPKCILGFNKNHGEEISLRLRTDDLKGFRKYESIKKTLLHELAHMVHSEHDANFHALDKQLNQEAASLDWTRSRSHTLSGHGRSDEYEVDYVGSGTSTAYKVGGKTSDQLESARASSVAAAYNRFLNSLEGHEVHAEPDPDDSMLIENTQVKKPKEDEHLEDQNNFEPDPDDSQDSAMEVELEPHSRFAGIRILSEPDPDDYEVARHASPLRANDVMDEPDPDDSLVIEIEDKIHLKKVCQEPDPDDSEMTPASLKSGAIKGELMQEETVNLNSAVGQAVAKCGNQVESDVDKSSANRTTEVDSDGNHMITVAAPSSRTDEPDPDDEELQRIQDPVAMVCSRLQKTIEMLRSEVNPVEATSVLQTLFKIIRNVIEHPDEIKFRRLRKGNPQFQRNVANYKSAMEVLFLVGFNEDTISDEIGRAETYVVLKRNDPGLLWLAKSSLEMCIAH